MNIIHIHIHIICITQHIHINAQYSLWCAGVYMHIHITYVHAPTVYTHTFHPHTYIFGWYLCNTTRTYYCSLHCMMHWGWRNSVSLVYTHPLYAYTISSTLHLCDRIHPYTIHTYVASVWHNTHILYSLGCAVYTIYTSMYIHTHAGYTSIPHV